MNVSKERGTLFKESNVPLKTLTKSVSDMSEKFKETITTFLGSNMMTDLSAANSK